MIEMSRTHQSTPSRNLRRERQVLFITAACLFYNLDFILGAFPLYITTLGGSEREIGLLMGGFAAAAVASRPVLAKIAERRGLRAVVRIAAVMGILGPALYLVAPSVGWLGLTRVVHAAVPAGFVMTIPLMLVDRSAPDRRGRALGLFGVMGGTSLLIAPAFGIVLMKAGGMALVAAFSTLAAVTAFFLVRAIPDTPESLPETESKASVPLLRDPVILTVLALNLLITLTFGMALTFAPVHGTSLGITNPGSFYTAFAVGSMATRYYSGRIIDIHGSSVVGPLAFVVLTAGLGLLAAAEGLSLFIAGAALMGAGFGTCQTLLWTHLVETVRGNRSMVTAWFANAFDTGIILGSVAGGLIAENLGFTVMYGVGASLAFVALSLWRLSRRWREDQRAEPVFTR